MPTGDASGPEEDATEALPGTLNAGSSSSIPPSPKQSITNEVLEDEEGAVSIGEQERILTEEARLKELALKPWYSRPTIRWLLPFVFLLAIMMGISSAPQEQMIIKIICKDYLQRRDGGPVIDVADSCNTPAVQAMAAVVLSRLRSAKYICCKDEALCCFHCQGALLTSLGCFSFA